MVVDGIRVGGLQFNFWIYQMGVSRSVGYEWRKAGWAKAVNISGKWYINQEEIDRFWARVGAGEFAGPVAVIPRKKTPKKDSEGAPTSRPAKPPGSARKKTPKKGSGGAED